MIVRTIVCGLLLCGAAQGQLPPVVYVAGPPGDTSSAFASGQGTPGPYEHPDGCDLRVRHADGRIETLVAGHQMLADRLLLSVTDPCVTADFSAVDYAHIGIDSRGARIADIYRFDLATRKAKLLSDASNEWSPPRGTYSFAPFPTPKDDAERKAWNAAKLSYLERGVWNLSPAEDGEGRIVFVSDRDTYRKPKKTTRWQIGQLYAMDADGQNVERIGHHNIGGAMHPIVTREGWVVYSSGENHGLRTGNPWSLLRVDSEGGDFGPEVSSLGLKSWVSPKHFQAQTSDGSIVYSQYYQTRPWASLLVAPLFAADPFGPPTMFGSPDYRLNDAIANGSRGSFKMAFGRRGSYSLTPTATVNDVTPTIQDGRSVGGFSHPAAGPNNSLFVSWRQDDVLVDGHREIGIYRIPDITKPVTHWNQLELVVDEPGVMEIMPRYFGLYADLYGVAKPAVRHYERTPLLPEGSPLALVGTSSLGWRESQSIAQSIQESQGSDYGVATDEIEYIAVAHQKPNERLAGGVASTLQKTFANDFDERVAILGDPIPIRKWLQPDGTYLYGPDQPGELVRRAFDGAVDTSFAVMAPADQSFTFAYLDRDQNFLGLSQVWRNSRPRQDNTKCQGCHAHNQPDPCPFLETFAAKPEYDLRWLTAAQPVVEYYTDVRPIFERHGVVDAAGEIHTATSLKAADLVSDFRSRESSLVKSLYGYDGVAVAYPDMTADEKRTISWWIGTGMTASVPESKDGPLLTPETMRGAWGDTNPPTLTLVPDRRPAAPVTQIIVGAADPDSGLNVESLSVKADFAVNGRAAGEELADMFVEHDLILNGDGTATYSFRRVLDLDAPVTTGTITASIRDNQQARKVDGTPLGEAGNLTTIVRSFETSAAAELASLYARRDELSQQIGEFEAELAQVEARIAELEGQ